MPDAMIFVGALTGAFGVKGEVRLKSFTSSPEAIADYSPLFNEDGTKSFNVILTGQIKNAFSARLSGVKSKEQAASMRGLRLFVPRNRLPQLPNDEFYYADLFGLAVFDCGGQSLGHIEGVQNHGATDLLEIKRVDFSQTVLIPFTRLNVPTVDLKSGKVIIDPPDGLFVDKK
ncbi:MAG: 16S rRNA processing protein RimM [Rhodobacteraceae bacterium]|nr:16S rRNA processing protein RimM [Paracoccaceae bacterium]